MPPRHQPSPIDPFGLEGPPSRLASRASWQRTPVASPTVGHSLAYAWQGVRYAFATQRNLRLQAAIGALMVGVACWLGLPPSQVALVIALIALVLCAELMNTAIEATLDECVGVAFDPAVKRIKDMAAASVAVVCLGAGILGASLFLPALAQRLFS